jgi:hypothetical protein
VPPRRVCTEASFCTLGTPRRARRIHRDRTTPPPRRRQPARRPWCPRPEALGRLFALGRRRSWWCPQASRRRQRGRCQSVRRDAFGRHPVGRGGVGRHALGRHARRFVRTVGGELPHRRRRPEALGWLRTPHRRHAGLRHPVRRSPRGRSLGNRPRREPIDEQPRHRWPTLRGRREPRRPDRLHREQPPVRERVARRRRGSRRQRGQPVHGRPGPRQRCRSERRRPRLAERLDRAQRTAARPARRARLPPGP